MYLFVTHRATDISENRPTWLLAICLALLQTGAKYDAALTDHCLNESFNATCPEGRVVLVTEARFGRMRPGRCIGGAFNVGCSKDIKSHLDALCTARQRCDISIRDLVDLHPCQRDFVSYLEASYICIEVSGLENNECPPSGHVRLYGRQDGYLVWTVAQYNNRLLGTTFVGSDHCPWTILVEQGQRINLTVVVILPPDGASCATDIVAEQPNHAGSHVVLQTNVCKAVSGNQSKRHMLISTGNMLQVYIKTQANSVNTAFVVLLHYAAVGCATPRQLPENAIMERAVTDPDRLVVKCNKSIVETTWYLTCHDGRWLGINDLNNCTTTIQASNYSSTFSVIPNITVPDVRPSTSARQYKLTAGLAWAVAVGVILGMFAGLFLLLSVHCIQRAVYTTANTRSTSRDEMNSQSEERYSFWRESNRYSNYQTETMPTAHEMMTSQQQVASVAMPTSSWLLSCNRCLKRNHKDAVTMDTDVAQSPVESSSDKRPHHRGRKIARVTVDCNNSGAWRPDAVVSSLETWQQFKLNTDERRDNSWPTRKNTKWPAGVDEHQMVMLDYRPGFNNVCIHRPTVESPPRMNVTTWAQVDLLPTTSISLSPTK